MKIKNLQLIPLRYEVYNCDGDITIFSFYRISSFMYSYRFSMEIAIVPLIFPQYLRNKDTREKLQSGFKLCFKVKRQLIGLKTTSCAQRILSLYFIKGQLLIFVKYFNQVSGGSTKAVPLLIQLSKIVILQKYKNNGLP